jgi:hypothetical protein
MGNNSNLPSFGERKKQCPFSFGAKWETFAIIFHCGNMEKNPIFLHRDKIGKNTNFPSFRGR